MNDFLRPCSRAGSVDAEGDSPIVAAGFLAEAGDLGCELSARDRGSDQVASATVFEKTTL